MPPQSKMNRPSRSSVVDRQWNKHTNPSAVDPMFPRPNNISNETQGMPRDSPSAHPNASQAPNPSQIPGHGTNETNDPPEPNLNAAFVFSTSLIPGSAIIPNTNHPVARPPFATENTDMVALHFIQGKIGETILEINAAATRCQEVLRTLQKCKADLVAKNTDPNQDTFLLRIQAEVLEEELSNAKKNLYSARCRFRAWMDRLDRAELLD